MRELRATGWMHPRVRAIAAAFLCFDLGVDWRVGRDEWDVYLVEADPALAAGKRQWIAGVGAESVRETVCLANRAAEAGYHAALVLTPHYYPNQMQRPDIQALYFRAVADQSKLPVLLGDRGEETGEPRISNLADERQVLGSCPSRQAIARCGFQRILGPKRCGAIG